MDQIPKQNDQPRFHATVFSIVSQMQLILQHRFSNLSLHPHTGMVDRDVDFTAPGIRDIMASAAVKLRSISAKSESVSDLQF